MSALLVLHRRGTYSVTHGATEAITRTDDMAIHLRSISPVEDSRDHQHPPSEGALGLFFATAPSRIQHPPLPPLEEEQLPIVPTITTRSRAATVPQPRVLPSPAFAPTLVRPTPHALYTPRTTRAYPQPHVVEIAREKIGGSPSPSSPASRTSDLASPAPRQKEATRRRFFGLWKETVTTPAANEHDHEHDLFAAWDREQRRAREMTLAAALDNKPRFAFVEPAPTEPISRVSSNGSSDAGPADADADADTDRPDADDCRGLSAFFRSLFHRRIREHVRRPAPVPARA